MTSKMGGIQDHASNKGERSLRIDVLCNDVRRINHLSQKMPKEICSGFKERYGSILDLLFIPVETPVLSALAQFWNSELRCFVLPSLDLVPTIEEYETMIGKSIKQESGVYLYRETYVGAKKAAELIDLPLDRARFEERNATHGWGKTILENHLESLLRQENWGGFSRTLALLIFGLVLLPSTSNMVDQAAIDVFFRYETRGENFIPSVLAETFLSLEICHEKRGGKLRGCPHLLYVWIMSLLFVRDHLGPQSDSLRSFPRTPMEKRKPVEWKKEFSMFNAKGFSWECP